MQAGRVALKNSRIACESPRPSRIDKCALVPMDGSPPSALAIRAAPALVGLTDHVVRGGEHRRHRSQKQRLGAYGPLAGRASHPAAGRHSGKTRLRNRFASKSKGGAEVNGLLEAASGFDPVPILHGDAARTAQSLRRVGRRARMRAALRSRCVVAARRRQQQRRNLAGSPLRTCASASAAHASANCGSIVTARSRSSIALRASVMPAC